MNGYLNAALAMIEAMSRRQNVPQAPLPDPKVEARKLALDYGKSMFSYHAGQRHTALNYYFVALAALVTGIVTVFARVELWTSLVAPLIVTALAAAGVLLCVCFWSLDRRNQSLVNFDKELLIALEKDLEADNPAFGILQAGDQWAKKNKWKTYRRIVPSVLFTFVCVFLAMAVIAWADRADIKTLPAAPSSVPAPPPTK